MTTIAAGASATITVAPGGQVAVASNGGIWVSVETPMVGPVRTVNHGPTAHTRIFGPYAAGATLVITNQSVNAFNYVDYEVGTTTLGTIAVGSNQTFTLTPQGTLSVSNPSGYWQVSVTPAIGNVSTAVYGPGTGNMVFGPYQAGATVVVTNQTGAALVTSMVTAQYAFITGTIGGNNVLTANVSASVTATSWQWTRNGSNIGGATASTYTQVPATDSGTTIGVSINGGALTASVSIPAIPPVFSAAPIITAATTTAVSYTAATLSNVGTPTATLLHDLYDGATLVQAGYTSGATITPALTAGDTVTLRPRAVQGGVTVTGATSSGFTVTGGAAVPAGGMKTLTINDATPIDPLLKSSGSTIGASGSGWVATIVLKGLTSLVGTCDPTQLTLSVTDPGYTTAGSATTVSRTITGVAQVRRQWPSGASKMISTDGTDLTLLITLDDWIYTGTTIVSATIGSGFYTGCTAGNTGLAITNSSTIPYTKPLFGWINPQAERATGNSMAVEAVAFHRHARAGQQVAAIQFSVTDGSTTTSPAIVNTPTLSTRQTKGYIAEVWAATLDVSTLATAQIINASAKVYPWLGDSSAVLDLAVTGTAWPTSLPQTLLRIFNDRTGTYGGAYAYVQVGASGGTVSKTAATAAAAPFPTLVAAMNAVKTFNNANGISHNDHGGAEIRLMDAAGSAVTHTVSTAPTVDATPSATWYTITNDPAATGAITVAWAAQASFPSMVRYAGNVTHASQVGVSYTFIGPNTARSMIQVDGITIDGTLGTGSAVTWYSMKYLLNMTVAGGRFMSFSNLADATANIVSMIGCVGANDASAPQRTTDQAKLTIGCDFRTYTAKADTNATGDGDDGRIFYNNRLLSVTMASASLKTLAIGMANVQNLWEHDGSDAGAIAMNFFADSDLTTITNYLDMHNTSVGNRASRLYNDIATSQVAPNGIIKSGTSLYSLYDNYNCKSDTFNNDGIGATGNWAYYYSVGNRGNVSLFGNVQRGATSSPKNDNNAEYLGGAWLPSSDYNLFRTSYGFTQAQIMAMFPNYTVAPQAVPARNGNYVPLSTSSYIKGRVPVGFSILKRDLAGTLRRTDGTGAAGAYESS